MKKSKYQNKNYKSISKLENYLLSLLKENELKVFSVNEILKISCMKRTTIHNILYSLTKKGFVVRVKRNCFVVKNEIPGNEFEIATSIVIPSYISFWTALSFYGFTDQQVKVIQLVSPKEQKGLRFENINIEITTFSPKRFFGYVRLEDFTIAEKEKCLVDSLSFPSKAGGIKEVSKCLNSAWREINKEKFTEYLLRFGNKSAVCRAGFLIEKLGLTLSKKIKNKLLSNLSASFILLEPQNPPSKLWNKKWKVNVNW